MSRAAARTGRAVLLLACGGALACGGRSRPDAIRSDPTEGSYCQQDTDCENGDRCTQLACIDRTCVVASTTSCTSSDPCMTGTCSPDTGECFYKPATSDADGDGHRAPLEGTYAGAEGSCGDDCDDTNASVHPGALEVCDGVDNNCDGAIDEGTTLSPSGDAVRVSDGTTLTTPEGLGYAPPDGTYLCSYTTEVDGIDAFYVVSLEATGKPAADPVRFTHVGANSYAGRLAWIGDRFVTAWSDKREQLGSTANYEVYFNEMSSDGSKLWPDLRVTSQVGFSVDPALAWTGSEFVVVWQDDGPSDGVTNELLAQRITADLDLTGSNVRLLAKNTEADGPSIATGRTTRGVAWVDGNTHSIGFAVFDANLSRASSVLTLTASGESGARPRVVYGTRGYTIVWYDPSGAHPISGAIIDETGAWVVKSKSLVDSTRHTRYPTTLSYGDRTLVVYSDDRDNNQGYEVYAMVLDGSLERQGDLLRITNAPGDSIAAEPAFGPAGDVGVVFRDDRDGLPQVYFSRLSCAESDTAK